MSRTIAFPLRITARGGLAMESDNIGTLIALGVLPTGQGIPYDARDGLLVESHVWESDTPEREAAVRSHGTREFDRLEARGKARLDSVERVSVGGGEVEYVVRWLNLQTGASDEVVLPARTG